MKLKIILIGICVFGLMTVPTTGFFGITEQENHNHIIISEEIAEVLGEKAIKDDISCKPMQTKMKSLGEDTQITTSEDDESHPSIDLDYNGNPFLLYHSRPDLFSSAIFMQRSLDGGVTWPEDLIWFWEWEDLSAINPEINFVDGVRAFGVHELAEQDPFLYFHDYVDIEDPTSWAMYYFDRSGAATYVTETSLGANVDGVVALGSIQDYQGDEYFEDTLLITWDADNFNDDTADGGVYWLNKDNDGYSIPYSNLCADAGDKVFFVFQREPFDDTSQIACAYCKVDEFTLYSDWRQSTVAASSRYNNSFPDVSVSGNKAFVAFMSDKNGNQDIYVASSTSGSFWQRYQVTDSVDDEMYPTISANGDEVTVLFMKNGNLYSTSSEDAGKTWDTPQMINDEENTIVEEFKNTDVSGTYGVWTDNRNDNNDIFFEEVGLAPFLVIDEIKGGFGLQITFSNVGNAPAEDIMWTIDVEGGFLLTGSHSEGIVTIAIDSSVTVKSDLIFGLGSVSITATCGDATKSTSGFVLGPFVLGVE
jgi:hypothetical protein